MAAVKTKPSANGLSHALLYNVVLDAVSGHFASQWTVCHREFAQGVDVLTVEIEHIDADALVAVQQELGVDVEPTPGTLRLIQVSVPKEPEALEEMIKPSPPRSLPHLDWTGGGTGCASCSWRG